MARPLVTDPAQLVALHVEALFLRDGDGRLVETNEGDPAPAPRVFLARSAAGVSCHTRRDVPVSLVTELTRLADALPAFPQHLGDLALYAAIEAAVAAAGPPPRRSFGPAFDFSTAPRRAPAPAVVEIADDHDSALTGPFADFRGVLHRGTPFLAIVRDGAVVSACHCARRTPAAAEAGLETVAAQRRRGYAVAVVAAWREALESTGRTPLYSTSYDNAASRGVARRLGLRQYAETFALT